MVSNAAIFSMAIAIIISVGTPIGLLIYFRKKYRISYKAVIVGSLTWIIFSQVLEKLLHLAVLNSTQILAYPLIFAMYGALAAGVFEEVGRYIFYKLFLKGKTEWKDGVAFGIGHGGIEAIIIGLLMNLQLIVFALMINNGTFQLLRGKLPAAALEQLKSSVLLITPITATLGGFERLFAIVIQIFFSMLVLYGIKQNKKIYLLLAILAHTFVDISAGLYQAKIISNIYFIELSIMVMAVAAYLLIIKLKYLFIKSEEEQRMAREAILEKKE